MPITASNFFLKKNAIEIKYEEEEYLIVPQAAILVLLREESEEETEWV